MGPSIRAAIADADPRTTVLEMQPMTELVNKSMAPIRFSVVLISIFAAVAVVLAVVGLYGVLSTVVRQRTAEIGVRMAFGATRANILRLVVGEGLASERRRRRGGPDRGVRWSPASCARCWST